VGRTKDAGWGGEGKGGGLKILIAGGKPRRGEEPEIFGAGDV